MGSQKGTEMDADIETFEVRVMMVEELEPVEEILGYKFNDRSLASEALTHPSFNPHVSSKTFPNYDRLEYLGDAVISLLVAKELFTADPQYQSGPLTNLHSKNVDTEKFARIAVNHGLHRYVRHRKPLLEDQVQQFIKDTQEYPMHSNGLVNPPKVLADIVESLIGAIFLYCNNSLEIVWKVFYRLAEPLINQKTLRKHPMSQIFEFCQKRRMTLKFETNTSANNTMVRVLIDGNLIVSGTYTQKKEIALNRAAKDALDRLKEESEELDFTLLSLIDQP